MLSLHSPKPHFVWFLFFYLSFPHPLPFFVPPPRTVSQASWCNHQNTNENDAYLSLIPQKVSCVFQHFITSLTNQSAKTSDFDLIPHTTPRACVAMFTNGLFLVESFCQPAATEGWPAHIAQPSRTSPGLCEPTYRPPNIGAYCTSWRMYTF